VKAGLGREQLLPGKLECRRKIRISRVTHLLHGAAWTFWAGGSGACKGSLAGGGFQYEQRREIFRL